LALQTPKFYLAGSQKSRKSGFLRSIDRKNPHLKQALMKRLLPLVLLCVCLPVYAADLGLVLHETLEIPNGDFSNRQTFTPWVSALFGSGVSLYLSGNLTLQHDSDTGFRFIPEPGYCAFGFDSGKGFTLDAGRLRYSDPLGYVASGLFDGLNMTLHTRLVQVSLGGFYTGLLYKESADVVMSADDLLEFVDEDVWFAPRRTLLAAQGTLGIGGSGSLTLGGLAQFDLRDGGRLHSQYILGKAAASPLRGIDAEAGGVFGFVEPEGQAVSYCGAFSVNAGLALPTPWNDRLAVGLWWFSGAVNEEIGPFLPLTALSPGTVFSPRQSALMLPRLVYTGRLHRALSLEVRALYFMRTDTETLRDGEMEFISDSYMLGGEFYAMLVWVPFSDVSFSLGGGVFLPGLGDALHADETRFHAAAGLIFSF
jgi:hypothetical protein